jgi:EmrB/QacA subfamily drug resistance transporter
MGSEGSSKKQRRVVLGVMVLALMMVVSATSGLNIALPDLARSTGASQTQVEWIVDVYALVFSGLLLPAGALGDRYGRKGVLLAGLVVFGVAAAAAVFVTSPAALIAARAVMGVGAALVMPTTLSVITTSFPPEERAAAVGVWVGGAGGGAVLGLFASGLLLEWFSWSSFFSLNVVLAVLALVGALAVVPSSRADEPVPLDPVGVVLSVTGVAAVVYATIEGPTRGWTDGVTAGAFAVAAAAIVAFLLWELRRPRPMLDPRLFKLRGFGMGSLSITVQFLAAFGFFFVVIQYLQYVAGYTPLRAAAAMLPLPVVLIPLARAAPRIAVRVGLNRVDAGGLALMAGGFVILSFLGTDFSYWLFAAGLVVFAAGMGLAGTPATAAITSSLPEARQGVASAVNDTSRELGGALGIAVLGSLLNDRYRSGVAPATGHLPAAAAAHVKSSIAFVQQAAPQFGAGGRQIAAQAAHAYVDGLGLALLTGAALLAVAALVVSLRAPRSEREAEPQVGRGLDSRVAGRPVATPEGAPAD